MGIFTSCWEFLGIGSNPSLEITEEDPLTEDRLRRIKPRSIQKIFLRKEHFSPLSRFCFANLTSLTIGHLKLSDEDTSVLGRLAPRLTKLGIFYCEVNESTLGEVLGSCTELRVLRISRMETTIVLLQAISKAPFAKILQKLDLSRFVGDSATECIAACIRRGHPDYLGEYAKLGHMRDPERFLREVQTYQSPDPLLVPGAAALFKAFESLHSLTLDGRKECTDEFVSHLELKLTQLRVICTGTTHKCALPGARIIRSVEDLPPN